MAATFITELVKFRLIPPADFFNALKSMLEDFAGQNVETVGTLLSGAGRFLFKQKQTHVRLKNSMQVLVKVAKSKNLEPRLALLLDSAILSVDPPEHPARRRKRLPPVHAYICHLLETALLDSDSVIPLVKKLRRLAWAENEEFLVKALLSTVKGRFSHANHVASLAAALGFYHPTLPVYMLDNLLEEVRWGLEHPEDGNYQKRVAHARLLGEMYNYKLANTRVIFDTLYLMLGFGHEDPDRAAKLDPPTSCFRIKLVRVVLEACGRYFTRGSSYRRLDRFFLYLQRYILAKPALPMDVQFDIEDLFQGLRPETKRWESFEEAAAAVAELEAEEAAAKAAGILLDVDDNSEDGRETGSYKSSEPAEADGAGVTNGQLSDVESDTSSGTALYDFDDIIDDDDDEDSERPPPMPVFELDEDFEREFAAVLKESGVPHHAHAHRPLPRAHPKRVEAGGQEDEEHVSITLLLRKGNKTDRTVLEVPRANPIASRLMADAAKEERERAQMKRFAMEATRRDGDVVASPLPRPIRQGAPIEATAPVRGGRRGRSWGRGG
eukprot:jgi/Botrbrau1/5794/Bobra.0155s0017.1